MNALKIKIKEKIYNLSELLTPLRDHLVSSETLSKSKDGFLLFNKYKTSYKSWFYACFLAVIEVEKNANTLFGDDLLQLKPLKVKNIYLKTATHKTKILNLFDGSLKKLKNYNPHLRYAEIRQKKYLPAGVPLVIPANRDL